MGHEAAWAGPDVTSGLNLAALPGMFEAEGRDSDDVPLAAPLGDRSACLMGGRREAASGSAGAWAGRRGLHRPLAPGASGCRSSEGHAREAIARPASLAAAAAHAPAILQISARTVTVGGISEVATPAHQLMSWLPWS